MKIISNITVLSFVTLSLISCSVGPSSSDFEKARTIIAEMDEIAGTYIKAPKEDALQKPVRENLEHAIKLLYNIQDDEENSYDVCFLLARAYGMLYSLDTSGSFEETVTFASRAIQINPKKQDPHLFLAVFYTNSGHPAEAVNCYWDALWLEDEKPHVALLRGLAIAYMYLGDGLWSYSAARQHLNHFPVDSSMKSFLEATRCIANNSLLNAVEIEFSPDGIDYKNKALHYSFKIPPGWRIAQKVHDNENVSPKHEAIIMGLPIVKDNKGNKIENAVGFSAFHKQNADEAKIFSKAFLQTSKNSYSRIVSEGRNWFVYEQLQHGDMYKGRLEIQSIDEFVYIVNYTATPETYDKNRERFERWYSHLKRGTEI